MALVEVFNNGVLYEFVRSGRHQSSFFGGPAAVVIDGMPRRSSPLHHIVTLWNNHIDLGSAKFGFQTPFFYGLRYEGCELIYQRTASAAVKVTSLNPRSSSDDYPYAGCPDILPYVPLTIGQKTDCNSEQFFGRISNTGWDFHSNKVYVVVPDPPDIGFTIWGHWGHDTDIVFEYDPETGILRACNQCT